MKDKIMLSHKFHKIIIMFNNLNNISIINSLQSTIKIGLLNKLFQVHSSPIIPANITYLNLKSYLSIIIYLLIKIFTFNNKIMFQKIKMYFPSIQVEINFIKHTLQFTFLSIFHFDHPLKDIP